MLEIKQILKNIVQQEGNSVFMDINKLEDLMKKNGINDFKMLFLITNALKINIIQDLIDISESENYNDLLNEIICKIENQLGLSEESCKWITDILSYALDIVDFNGQKIKYTRTSKLVDDIWIIKENEKYGLCNEQGDVILKCNFGNLEYREYPFGDHRSDKQLFYRDTSSNKYGCIRKDKETVVEPLYDFIDIYMPGSNHDMSAKIMINDKYGFIDSNGKMVVKAEIDEIIKPELKRITNKLAGYMDGIKWIMSIEKWYIAKLRDKYALFDENHKCVMEIQYDNIFKDIYYSSSYKGYKSPINLIIRVENRNKYGLILIELNSNDNAYVMKSWRYIVEPVCDSINLFDENEGIFMPEINHKFGFINHNGESILSISYDYIEELNLAEFANTKEAKILKIGRNGKHGFAKFNGEIILNPEYDKIYEFQKFSCLGTECLAKLCIDEKYGYINADMDKIVPTIFDQVNFIKYKTYAFNSEPLILVKAKGMYGLMNIYGKMIVKPQFSKILSLAFYDIWTKVKFSENNIVKYAYVDDEGNCKLTCDLIEEYQKDKKYIVIKCGNKYGCISKNGEIILDTIYDEIRHIKYKNIFVRVKIGNQYKLVDNDKNHIIDIQNIQNPTEDEQLEAIEYDINYIKYIKNPTEKVQLKVIKQVPDYIEYIENPSESAQLEAIKQKIGLIACIKNPTENVQMEVIAHKAPFISYLKKPLEKVQLSAILSEPSVIKYIKNPSEKVQLLAVKRQASAIEYIKNPTEEVQLIAVSFQASYINYIKNPCKSVLEQSNVKEYYGNKAIKLKSDNKYEIPEYEPGESSLLDRPYY